MKSISIIITCLWLLSATPLKAQESLPAKINDYIVLNYHDATDIEWYSQEDKIIVEFKEKGFEFKIFLNKNYNLLETHKQVNPSKLPTQITDYLENEIEDYEILNCTLIKDNSRHYFEILVETETDVYEFLFDLDGDIIE